jgi:hypothetical protein
MSRWLRVPLPNLRENFEIVTLDDSPCFDDHKRTSKKPNSYGDSGGPIMIALTLRTSTSRQATASAIYDEAISMDASVHKGLSWTYTDPQIFGYRSTPV